MLTRIVLILMTVALSACGTSSPYRMGKYTNNMPGTAFQATEDGISDLETRANEPFMHAVYGEAFVQVTVNQAELDAGTLAQAQDTIEYCTISISPIVTGNQDLKNILAHELGHCFGLQHVLPDVGEVMSPDYGFGEAYPDAVWARFMYTLKQIRFTG